MPGEVWESLRDPGRTKAVRSVSDGFVAFVDSERGGPYEGRVGEFVEYNRLATSTAPDESRAEARP